MTIPQPLADSLADIRQKYGDEAMDDVQGYLKRNYPADKRAFLDVLYADLKAVRKSMARSASQFQDAAGKPWGEDQISNHIKALLDAKALNRVTAVVREAGMRGHVDITVEQRRLGVMWIAEAKLDGGPLYISGGLAQLHSRYASGFEEDVGLLIYCFGEKAKLVLAHWRTHMVAEKLQGFVRDWDDDDLSFWSEHEHVGTGSFLRTCHLIFPLYFKPEQ